MHFAPLTCLARLTGLIACAALATGCATSGATAAGDGLISKESAYSVTETADRLERQLKAQGLRVFIRVDHAEGANGAGIELRPTTLLLFGNPRVGAPLMACSQTAAIDLPQKALIYKADDGRVWLTYNDPRWVAQRHSIQGCDSVIIRIADALDSLSGLATAP